MQIRELLTTASGKLQEASIELAFMEARLLLALASGLSQEELILNYDQDLKEIASKKIKDGASIDPEELFFSYIERRCLREPIAYITGIKEFYGREFVVNKNVLIPRSETELLVDAVLDWIREQNVIKDTNGGCDSSYVLNMLDIGVGSGNISCSLLLEVDNLKITAIDISKQAIEVAIQNIDRFALNDRICFIQSDLFKNLGNLKEKFDIIVSNPPYIDVDDKDIMAQETVLFEPETALYAQGKGLKIYEEIFKEMPLYLKPNGFGVFEIGIGQAADLQKLARNYGITIEKIFKDMQGIERVIICRVPL